MTDGQQTDGQLLAAFAARGDEAAFAAVVGRHAAMVLSVCRTRLGSLEDAQDAAQAVFAVLARKASALRWNASVAAWLHHVARCVAIDAQRAAAARLVRERRAVEMTADIMADRAAGDELRARLAEELDSLPDKYRTALILFHMQGNSLAETAQLMNLPLSTAGNRLARGRELLRARLARRGAAVASIALLAGLLQDAGAANVPAGFVAAACKAGVLFAAGKTAAVAGGLSAPAATLAQGTLKVLFYAQLKTAAVFVAVAAVAAGTAGTVLVRARSEAATRPGGRHAPAGTSVALPAPQASGSGLRPASAPPKVSLTGRIRQHRVTQRTNTGERTILRYTLTTPDETTYALWGTNDLSVLVGEDVTVAGEVLATSAGVGLRISEIRRKQEP